MPSGRTPREGVLAGGTGCSSLAEEAPGLDAEVPGSGDFGAPGSGATARLCGGFDLETNGRGGGGRRSWAGNDEFHRV